MARFEKPPLTLLSSIAHAVGKPSFEALTVDQRLSALQIATTLMVLNVLSDVSSDVDAIRERGQ